MAISTMRASPAWRGAARGRLRRTRVRSPIRQRDGGALARPEADGKCRGGPHHVLDGPYAGDGIFGEGKRHGHRAHQLAIDIDRAAAHALHDPGMFQRPARKPRQDERFLGADVIQHAQDFDLEFIDLAARKDGPAGAAHAGLERPAKERSRFARREPWLARRGPGPRSGAHNHCSVAPRRSCAAALTRSAPWSSMELRGGAVW